MSLSTDTDQVVAIRQLTYEYARCIDRFDIEGLMRLWTQTATFDERFPGGKLTSGLESLKQFFAADFDVRSASAHFMTNHVIDELDASMGRGSCYALALADYKTRPSLRACVQYTDEYVKVDGGWRFGSRIVSLLTPIEFTPAGD